MRRAQFVAVELVASSSKVPAAAVPYPKSSARNI